MNHDAFWGIIRENLFARNMSIGSVSTINAIVDTCYAEKVSRSAHFAYILATAYHESFHSKLNPEWLPVREGFTKTNEGAINAVTKLFNSGKISHNYGLAHTNGHSYYGRGFVQITWPENYRKMGRRLGIPLYENPDLALDRNIAAKLLVIGMMEGMYTGRKLSDYDDVVRDGLHYEFDSLSARRIINGTDRAETISGYYEIFLLAINASIND
ncbi:glycoside hydrolase family 19 protein [Parapedobacter indicus]|uniref:Predicted chitinase n=1 Tax=Parapedobacter indicus TaxID=1477437 RepID=A0A1I3VT81_9SPHI|nr:glycoside hydrolase family 19 protein [Parapedobacter indicus]PPK97846.1 putative chitinase [Parapedobacter indicus]SFJ98113.1 Predicted chitinase [Parapedobacter indicus]